MIWTIGWALIAFTFGWCWGRYKDSPTDLELYAADAEEALKEALPLLIDAAQGRPIAKDRARLCICDIKELVDPVR